MNIKIKIVGYIINILKKYTKDEEICNLFKRKTFLYLKKSSSKKINLKKVLIIMLFKYEINKYIIEKFDIDIKIVRNYNVYIYSKLDEVYKFMNKNTDKFKKSHNIKFWDNLTNVINNDLLYYKTYMNNYVKNDIFKNNERK